MLRVVLLVAVSVAAVAAHSLADLHHGEPVFYPTVNSLGQQTYAGVFTGVCHIDGVYYGSEIAITFCTNGRPVSQDCALGTKNSPLNSYLYGHYYGYDDFCNVSLLT